MMFVYDSSTMINFQFVYFSDSVLHCCLVGSIDTGLIGMAMVCIVITCHHHTVH